MVDQARVIYDLYAAGSGQPNTAPLEHPQQIMRQLAGELGFKIIGSVPQSMGDCWWFWIEYSAKPVLPAYIFEADWLPVGSLG